MGPLAGVRILDLTTVLMGPYATQILGDFGADVIKVESPDGDVVRQIGPARHPDMGPLFMNVNRSKRDIALDRGQPKWATTSDRVAGLFRSAKNSSNPSRFSTCLTVKDFLLFRGDFPPLFPVVQTRIRAGPESS